MSSMMYKILHIYGLNLKLKGTTRSDNYKLTKENLVLCFQGKIKSRLGFTFEMRAKSI